MCDGAISDDFILLTFDDSNYEFKEILNEYVKWGGGKQTCLLLHRVASGYFNSSIIYQFMQINKTKLLIIINLTFKL